MPPFRLTASLALSRHCPAAKAIEPRVRLATIAALALSRQRELLSLLPALPLSLGSCLEPAARAIEPPARLATIATLALSRQRELLSLLPALPHHCGSCLEPAASRVGRGAGALGARGAKSGAPGWGAGRCKTLGALRFKTALLF